MASVKFARLLPPVQVAIAETLFWMARHSHPPVRGDVYWHSTTELLALGLNTPAERLAEIVFQLGASFIGELSGELILLLFIAALWYLVGRRIDSSRIEGRVHRGLSNRTKVGTWLALLYGLYLFTFLCFNHLFTNFGVFDSLGDVVRQGMALIWSIALIFFPGIDLLKAFRKSQTAAINESGRAQG